jgi:hypothetical protein
LEGDDSVVIAPEGHLAAAFVTSQAWDEVGSRKQARDGQEHGFVPERGMHGEPLNARRPDREATIVQRRPMNEPPMKVFRLRGPDLNRVTCYIAKTNNLQVRVEGIKQQMRFELLVPLKVQILIGGGRAPAHLTTLTWNATIVTPN